MRLATSIICCHGEFEQDGKSGVMILVWFSGFVLDSCLGF
jgi:hypothetical protein